MYYTSEYNDDRLKSAQKIINQQYYFNLILNYYNYNIYIRTYLINNVLTYLVCVFRFTKIHFLIHTCTL